MANKEFTILSTEQFEEIEKVCGFRGFSFFKLEAPTPYYTPKCTGNICKVKIINTDDLDMLKKEQIAGVDMTAFYCGMAAMINLVMNESLSLKVLAVCNESGVCKRPLVVIIKDGVYDKKRFSQRILFMLTWAKRDHNHLQQKSTTKKRYLLRRKVRDISNIKNYFWYRGCKLSFLSDQLTTIYHCSELTTLDEIKTMKDVFGNNAKENDMIMVNESGILIIAKITGFTASGNIRATHLLGKLQTVKLNITRSNRFVLVKDFEKSLMTYLIMN